MSQFDLRPEVLFLCVHNAGRSQMAAAMMRVRSAERISVRSAGTNPKGEVHPVVREVMAEIGVDLVDAIPKLLTDLMAREADVVVSMGCGDACPIYPGKRYEDWPLDDPAGKSLEEVRRIRDEISTRVDALLANLLPSTEDPDDTSVSTPSQRKV